MPLDVDGPDFLSVDSLIDQFAAGLYSLASMLLGEGEDSAGCVEAAIAGTEVAGEDNANRTRQNSRRALAVAAIEALARRDASSLGAPEDLAPSVTCIDNDDLDAAAEYGQELERMIAGPHRDRVREWLESLATPVRTVFVLRAVAGFSPAEIATLLAGHGGRLAAGWSAGQVRELFRQGLCSLASQLLQETASR